MGVIARRGLVAPLVLRCVRVVMRVLVTRVLRHVSPSMGVPDARVTP
ncbi:hypothetical protein SGUI_1209 [Serinicoccus hydrothermalis]|uniref:Uncharacterized protein n=1 Tax=Serinicoccus hydrothermalis TaxID=1758689 RepID=A0A1B1NB53_9MICO|nr:hypothetical protein SGUI_1209 [Serinicoccus hydrothermalis]